MFSEHNLTIYFEAIWKVMPLALSALASYIADKSRREVKKAIAVCSFPNCDGPTKPRLITLEAIKNG